MTMTSGDKIALETDSIFPTLILTPHPQSIHGMYVTDVNLFRRPPHINLSWPLPWFIAFNNQLTYMQQNLNKKDMQRII